MMIICGAGLWEGRAMPVFSENLQQLHRSFFAIASSRVELFLKLSANEPDIFRNSQETIRSFFGILSNLIELFPELSARDLIFF
jgi:hypothetical protein